MVIEGPLSSYKRSNFLIGIAVCVGLSLWCGYDGYFSKTFQEKHAQWWRINRAAPFVLLPGAVVLGIWLYAARGRKLVAEENELIIHGKQRIPYDSIQQIDKTYFEQKGFFVVTYRGESGAEIQRRFDSRQYDNLKAILDHIVAKISAS